MPYSSLKSGKGFRPRKARMSRGTSTLHRSGNYGSTLKRAKREAGKVSTCKRDPKKALGTAKPREGSIRELKAKLESLNARYVKLRDGMECVQCKADGVPTRGILDAGHLYPKGTQGFKAGHYLVENIFAQCRTHNTTHISRPEYFINWFISEHGFEALDALHARCTSDWRPDREWLVETIAERERQLEEFELLAVA